MDRKVSLGLGSDGAGGPQESKRSRVWTRSDREFQSGGWEGPRGRDVEKADGGNRTRNGSRNPHPFRVFLGRCSSVGSLALKNNLLGRRTGRAAPKCRDREKMDYGMENGSRF